VATVWQRPPAPAALEGRKLFRAISASDDDAASPPPPTRRAPSPAARSSPAPPFPAPPPAAAAPPTQPVSSSLPPLVELELDAVTQLVRLAHASTASSHTRTWSAAHVYYPWSGTLRTTDTAHVTAEAWRAVWVVACAVLRGDAMDVDADEAGVGGRAHVALTVETEPWAVAMARG
jgi:hypothetical protein